MSHGKTRRSEFLKESTSQNSRIFSIYWNFNLELSRAERGYSPFCFQEDI
jgi:hypothetical protein